MQLTLKIAVPLFGERVSPHFGASSTILLIETQDGKITDRQMLYIGFQKPLDMARRLVSLGVDKLVCGGIAHAHKQWLTGNGIRVVDNQKGPAETVLIKIIETDMERNNRRK